MILTIALVSAGVTVLVEAAKYVVKKTKTKYDDKAVAYLEEHAQAIVDLIVTRTNAQETKAGREKTIDHRTAGK